MAGPKQVPEPWGSFLEELDQRATEELRWQLGNPEREDLTLKLWIEMIEEDRQAGHPQEWIKHNLLAGPLGQLQIEW